MEPRIAVAELGLSPAELTGYEIAPDWRGRPSLSLADAERVNRQRDKATAAHEAAWRAHRDDCEAWLAGRVEAARAAAQKAVEGQRPSPGRSVRYKQAWLQAALDYQRSARRPDWAGQPTISDGQLVAEADLFSVVEPVDSGARWAEVH